MKVSVISDKDAANERRGRVPTVTGCCYQPAGIVRLRAV